MSVLSWVASWTSQMSPNTKPAVKVAGAAVAVAAVTWLAIATPFVGGFEGFASKPYIDWNGSGHPETWCYGETAADGGPVPKMGTLFTKAECTASLTKKLQDVYYPEAKRCIPKLDTYPPHRIAGIVSFTYNLGPGATCQIARYFNAGNITAGCNAMLAYNHAAGRVLPGLTTRRRAERAYCLRTD